MPSVYIYAIVHRRTRPAVRRVPPGLPGASPPRLVMIDRTLWMVASDVASVAYSAERIEQGLKDLEWVARIAVAHQAVVDRFTRVGGATVVPMKLFTIFSSEDRACDEMRRRRPELDGVLSRIKGCQEWGVRVTRAAAVVGGDGKGGRPTSGTAFLIARKQARDAARDEVTRATRAAESAYRSLRKIARDVARREPPEAATMPPILDAAFLVPVAKQAQFKAAAAKSASSCRAAGADMVVTGPWPAYHFVQTGDPPP